MTLSELFFAVEHAQRNAQTAMDMLYDDDPDRAADMVAAVLRLLDIVQDTLVRRAAHRPPNRL